MHRGHIPDERREHDVQVVVDRKLQIGFVLFGHSRQVDGHGRQVYAFSAAQHTAVFDHALNIVFS